MILETRDFRVPANSLYYIDKNTLRSRTEEIGWVAAALQSRSWEPSAPGGELLAMRCNGL
jgi:hypothetical protein